MQKLLMKFFKLPVVIIFANILFFSSAPMAYQVKPMSKEIMPTGKQAQYSLRIDNTNAFPISLEFIPWKVAQDEHGINTLSVADNDLLVIPMSAVIQPGQSQTVMVRYLGEPMITQSEMYSIEVAQVKVSQGDKAQEIQLAFNFKTLLNVTPKNAAAKFKAGSFEKQKNGTWHLKVMNNGNRFAQLSETQWHVSDGQNSVTLSKGNIEAFVQGKLILPNAARIYKVKQLDNIDMSRATVEIKWLH